MLTRPFAICHMAHGCALRCEHGSGRAGVCEEPASRDTCSTCVAWFRGWLSCRLDIAKDRCKGAAPAVHRQLDEPAAARDSLRVKTHHCHQFMAGSAMCGCICVVTSTKAFDNCAKSFRFAAHFAHWDSYAIFVLVSVPLSEISLSPQRHWLHAPTAWW